MPHSFNSGIFRAYDIRGIVGQTLHLADAGAIGTGFAHFLRQQLGKKELRVALGYDGRESSPGFEQALAEALSANGVDVVRVGLGPTPMLYFAVKKLTLDGGIMVTGSHNPQEYNGFKLLTSKGSLYGDMLQQLKRYGELGIAMTARDERLTPRIGALMPHDISESYLEALHAGFKGRAQTRRSLNVVWDPGNGAAGEITERLVKDLPGKHIVLNPQIDGTFPNHHPDPTDAKNLVQLIDVVTRQKFDLGIAFDGDGDRIGVVDREGNIIWGDQLLYLYAQDVLRAEPRSTILGDVKASQVVFDAIEALGGKAIMWKTGHSLIKAKMAETGAKLAGEMSGHIFFADRYYGYDDALYAAVRLVEILSHNELTLEQLIAKLPVCHNTPELRIDCPEERKFSVVDEVRTRVQATTEKYSAIDGIRVMTADGWWLLRASNTQAALVARAEAHSPEGLKRLLTQLDSQLQDSGVKRAG